jgi:hypothetical protein
MITIAALAQIVTNGLDVLKVRSHPVNQRLLAGTGAGFFAA